MSELQSILARRLSRLNDEVGENVNVKSKVERDESPDTVIDQGSINVNNVSIVSNYCK